MAIELVGDFYTSSGFSDAAGGNSITDITIPADADMAMVCGGYGHDTGSEKITWDELNWDDGDTLDFVTIVSVASIKATAAYMQKDAQSGNWPGTGSGKTLYFSWNATTSTHQAWTCLFFLKGTADENIVIGTDTGNNEDPWTSDDLGDVEAGDMGFAVGVCWGQSNPVTDVTVNNQTEIASEQVGATMEFATGYKLGEDQPQIDYSATGTPYGDSASFAIKAAAGGENALPMAMNHYRQLRS